MNRKQKVVMWSALLLFGLTLLNAPYVITPPPQVETDIFSGQTHSRLQSSYPATSPLWDGPINGQLQGGALLLEWVGLAVVGFGVSAMVRTKATK